MYIAYLFSVGGMPPPAGGGGRHVAARDETCLPATSSRESMPPRAEGTLNTYRMAIRGFLPSRRFGG